MIGVEGDLGDRAVFHIGGSRDQPCVCRQAREDAKASKDNM